MAQTAPTRLHWACGTCPAEGWINEAHPTLGCISARVLVGAENRPDPTCDRMAASPLPRDGLPGPALMGFMAGACVMRRDAFRATGGYERRFYLGAEDERCPVRFAGRRCGRAVADPRARARTSPRWATQR